MWAVAVLGVATTTRGAGTTRLGLGKVPDDTNALPTVSLYPNENNVFSRAVLRNSTKEVVYLGNFPSSAGCQAACISQGSCKSFTYHEPNFDPVWATGCYASTTRFWKPVAESNVLTGTVGWTPPNAPPTPGPPTPSPPCRTRADCSMNGECDSSGVCRCTAAWTGSACDALNLVPSPKTLGYHAVDAASRNKTASWGGSIVYDDDGSAHMYAAEITGSCGMNVWLSNSRVIHAESPDPTTTPFTFAGEVAGVFSHEPIARRAPTGEYVVWFTAVLPPALPPVNGGKECTGCVDGVSPASCGTDSNRNSTTPLPTYMVWSTEPNGPWSTPVMIPGTAVFADSNFAPVIHANGSLVGLMRRNVVLADYWKDPSSYRFVATWNDHGEVRMCRGPVTVH